MLQSRDSFVSPPPRHTQEVPCPFYVNATILEQPTALLTIDDKYVGATVSFIEAHAVAATSPRAGRPFFVYFCSHHTHTPAFSKANFTNTSVRGWFGDHLRTVSVTSIPNPARSLLPHASAPCDSSVLLLLAGLEHRGHLGRSRRFRACRGYAHHVFS